MKKHSSTHQRSLRSPVVTSKMVWECLRKLKNLRERKKGWVQGHMGSEGNKEADALVRKGAAAPRIVSEPFCGSGDMFF